MVEPITTTPMSSACLQSSNGASMVQITLHQAEAINLLVKLLAMQATAQPLQRRPSGPKLLDRAVGHVKKAVEGAELLSKLWAWRRSISLTLSIAPWLAPWVEHIVGAVKWLF